MRQRTKANLKVRNGITLIALVVTIIVLIILAGVSINLILGQNGILTKATEAKTEITHAEVKEAMRLEYANYVLEKQEGSSVGTLVEYFQSKHIIGDANEEENYQLNVEKLLNKTPSLGTGTNGKDVYMLEEVTEGETYKIMYYGKTESENRELEILKEDISEKKEMIDFTVVHQTWYLNEETIFTVKYQCEKGMTWGQFIKSKYNTKEYVQLIQEATEGLFEENWQPFYSFMAGPEENKQEIIAGPLSGGEFSSSEKNNFPIGTDKIEASKTYYDRNSAG